MATVPQEGEGGEARALDKLRYDGGWSIKGQKGHVMWNATVKGLEFPDFLCDTDAREQNSHLCTWEFGKGGLSANYIFSTTTPRGPERV